ncbi:MBL fold metallo-hydrolase [Sabulilitoribacter arenilitoris]|uniref:MBL fold metallo-hydrolase n=1 Tax=Wocania arenilitoris TaxID=2044858 RepID=A0AAE3ERC4_9FLAO|nr:MBL fold metallo-hydrolase [Wocania arenilitoris]MCF7568814.1 MBL fold metallo-hydrolase [Wocania arenilitoris]
MYIREVKEEALGVYRFSQPIGIRIVHFYAIKEADGWTLIDCGLSNSVASWIADGELKGKINRLIITHADADHLGSGAWLKENYPSIEICCHANDKRYSEDHRLLVKNRYDVARPKFGFGYSQEVLDILLDVCGEDFEVDRTLEDQETILIDGDEWQIELLPGHSPGHIGISRKKDGIYILGDAFLSDGPPSIDGKPSMPPTHENIVLYLNSIKKARSFNVNKCFTGHWPLLGKEEFIAFLDKSEEVVFRDLKIVTSILEKGERSFEEILTELCEQVSTWDATENSHYLYAVNGYIKYLEATKKIVVTPNQKIKLKQE